MHSITGSINTLHNTPQQPARQQTTVPSASVRQHQAASDVLATTTLQSCDVAIASCDAAIAAVQEECFQRVLDLAMLARHLRKIRLADEQEFLEIIRNTPGITQHLDDCARRNVRFTRKDLEKEILKKVFALDLTARERALHARAILQKGVTAEVYYVGHTGPG